VNTFFGLLIKKIQQSVERRFGRTGLWVVDILLTCATIWVVYMVVRGLV